MIRVFVVAVVFGAALTAGCEDKSTKGTSVPPGTTSAESTTRPGESTADVGPPPRVVTSAGGAETK